MSYYLTLSSACSSSNQANRGQKEGIHLLETRDEAGKADGRFAAVQNLVKKDV
ncbi:unnamed protein product [Musa hybrid cultivar]